MIGLGKMGLLHTSILNLLPNVQLTALCDKSGLILKLSKKLFNKEIHVVKDIEKLSGLDLDVAYVTTPISSHSFLVKNLYLQEIARNLFVEKTLASSYDEAKELCDLAKKIGGVNMVGYMKRFGVTFNKAKDLLTRESLGDVISFKAHAYSSDFWSSKQKSKVASSRGGALRDLGSHAVELALWFFGDLHVDSAMLQSSTESASETSVNFKVKKSNGLTGEFDVSRCMKNYRLPEVGLQIEGSKGVLNVNDDKLDMELNNGESFVWYRHDLNDNVGFMLGAPEYFRENQYFINSVLEGRDAEPSFFTASKVDYLIDQVNCRVDENV